MRGHIRRRGLTWTAYWRETDLATGKRKQRSKGGHRTEANAEIFLARKIVELEDDGPLRPNTATVGQFARSWLAGKRRIKVGTRRDYDVMLRHQIEPHLGTTKLGDLTTADIRHWIASLEDSGISPSRIRSCRTVLRSVLDLAVAERMMRSNPARSSQVELPRSRAKRPQILDDEQLEKFLEVIQGHTHEMLFRFLLASQVRIGEALALRWERVDINAKTVEISERWYSEANDLDSPKTGSGLRTLHLDRETMDLLVIHRDRQRFGRVEVSPDMLIFPNSMGTYMTSATPRSALHRIQDNHGFHRFGLHTFRHTGATMLLRRGLPVHIVSHRLGHSNVRTTLDLYAHYLPADDAHVAEVMGDILAGSGGVG